MTALLTYRELTAELGAENDNQPIAATRVPVRFDLRSLIPVGCPIVQFRNHRMVDALAARRWLETHGGKFAMKFGPRAGAVYVVQSEHGGPIKIGWSKDVWRRLMVLQTARPDQLVLRIALAGDQAFESELHQALAPQRIRGEWFACDGRVDSFLAEASGGLSWRLRPFGRIDASEGLGS